MWTTIEGIFRQTTAHPCPVNKAITIFTAIPMGATHEKLLKSLIYSLDIVLSIVTA
jgi:hypothetical protein